MGAKNGETRDYNHLSVTQFNIQNFCFIYDASWRNLRLQSLERSTEQHSTQNERETVA